MSVRDLRRVVNLGKLPFDLFQIKSHCFTLKLKLKTVYSDSNGYDFKKFKVLI